MKEKEETKRYYKFTFEDLKKLLKLEGEFEAYGTKDENGKECSGLKIITRETTEEKPKEKSKE